VKKRSYRKKKDKNAPKKGKTAYILFALSIRNSIKNKYPDANFGDISKKIAVKWKKLPESKREKFKILAETDKKRYEREMKNYKKKKKGQFFYFWVYLLFYIFILNFLFLFL